MSTEGDKIETVRVPIFYSNSVQAVLTPWDCQLYFGQILQTPNGEQIERTPIVTIVQSPVHAKALQKLLTEQVAAYEEKYGQIPTLEGILIKNEEELSLSRSKG